MSYPDDELDSRVPGRREDAADEAACIEDQAVPHVVHLGSNAALANELNGLDARPMTVANLVDVVSVARYFGQPLRVTPAVNAEIWRVRDSVPPSSPTGSSLMPGTVEVITVQAGDENVVYNTTEDRYAFVTPRTSSNDHALAAKLANLSRLAEVINATGHTLAVIASSATAGASACELLAEEVRKFDSERS